MRPLFRMIIPAYPRRNIFSGKAKKTTALGPIMVATSANRLWDWRVEVTDENNWRGPRDSRGLPDHVALQKERPAVVVGFYCGLTSTIERVWKLAAFYRDKGVYTIAGGWHAHYCPEETLAHNINVVVHGDGEETIQLILDNFLDEDMFESIPGISFLKNSGIERTNPPRVDILDLDELPFPDFGLLRNAKVKIYPISRIRGCSKNCEFCSVKGEPRWSSPQYFFETVNWLVETRGAQNFFITDDRTEEDLRGTKEFFKMIADKYGNRLHFIVQVRLEIAKDIDFMEIMRNAGVRTVCVGVESPIDEDLRAMHKGYTSKEMLNWIKILHRYFWVHSMFIVGYPAKISGVNLGFKQIVRLYKRFIRLSGTDSMQIMLPGPMVGTRLRQRLEGENRLFPLDVVSWSDYDGSRVCFQPDNMSVQELQEMPLEIMSGFYNFWNLVKVPIRTISLPVHYFLKGWRDWLRKWNRVITLAGGYLLVSRRRKRRGDIKQFLDKIEEYQQRGE